VKNEISWPTVRECLAQGLGPWRTEIGRGDMTVAHARHLIEIYPTLYRHADSPAVGASPPFAREGFAVGDGWFTILDRLSAALAADQSMVVIQCKEKYGILALYCEPWAADPSSTEAAAAVDVAALDAALDAAVKASAVTCELCGHPSPGPQANIKGRVTTRCTSCGWLNDMAQACGFLAKIAEGKTREAFVVDFGAVVEAKHHITRHLCMGASYQSDEVRKRFPDIDWKKLDLWATIDSTDKMEQTEGDFTMEELEAMIFRVSPEEIWKFIGEDVPAIAKALW